MLAVAVVLCSTGILLFDEGCWLMQSSKSPTENDCGLGFKVTAAGFSMHQYLSHSAADLNTKGAVEKVKNLTFLAVGDRNIRSINSDGGSTVTSLVVFRGSMSKRHQIDYPIQPFAGRFSHIYVRNRFLSSSLLVYYATYYVLVHNILVVL